MLNEPINKQFDFNMQYMDEAGRTYDARIITDKGNNTADIEIVNSLDALELKQNIVFSEDLYANTYSNKKVA